MSHEREALAALRASPTGRGLLAGRTVMPSTTGARTDTVGVADFTVNFYERGATIIMQVFSKTAGAWRTTTLS